MNILTQFLLNAFIIVIAFLGSGVAMYFWNPSFLRSKKDKHDKHSKNLLNIGIASSVVTIFVSSLWLSVNLWLCNRGCVKSQLFEDDEFYRRN